MLLQKGKAPKTSASYASVTFAGSAPPPPTAPYTCLQSSSGRYLIILFYINDIMHFLTAVINLGKKNLLLLAISEGGAMGLDHPCALSSSVVKFAI